jgi:hypothetical protein
MLCCVIADDRRLEVVVCFCGGWQRITGRVADGCSENTGGGDGVRGGGYREQQGGRLGDRCRRPDEEAWRVR